MISCVGSAGVISNAGDIKKIENNGNLNFFIKDTNLGQDTFEKQSALDTEKKPAIAEKAKKMLEYIFKLINGFNADKKEDEQLVRLITDSFKSTPEGIRRMRLSNEEIKAEAQTLFNKSFDILGVPDNLRPELKILTAAKSHSLGGLYTNSIHGIILNHKSYRDGLLELDNAIMHEATHCKEALIRTGIPQDEVDETVKNGLVSKIKNGENKQIQYRIFENDNPVMIESVKIPYEMQNDFIDFAKENLYIKSKELEETLQNYCDNKIGFEDLKKKPYTLEIISKLNSMVKNHPEYVNQYQNEEEAFNNLFKYAISHNARYNLYTDTTVSNLRGDKVKIPELKGDELEYAKKSLTDMIKTHEATASLLYGGDTSSESIAQYLFSPEEILAEKNGHGFLIDNFTKKLEEKRKENSLSEFDELYLKDAIETSKNILDLKIRGMEYSEKLQENPENKELRKNLQKIIKKLLEGAEVNFVEENEIPSEFLAKMRA